MRALGVDASEPTPRAGRKEVYMRPPVVVRRTIIVDTSDKRTFSRRGRASLWRSVASLTCPSAKSQLQNLQPYASTEQAADVSHGPWHQVEGMLGVFCLSQEMEGLRIFRGIRGLEPFRGAIERPYGGAWHRSRAPPRIHPQCFTRLRPLGIIETSFHSRARGD